MTHRVGIGYDIHRLEPGNGVVIAGVHITCEYRVIAHSDGDVVLHALCDALLGAVGAGDLGEHFPDTDDAHRGRNSKEFVHAVLALPALKPWRVVNMDCNIIAQVPRLGPYKADMRAHLASLLSLPPSRIGVKARTNEGLDAVGEKKAIQAQVVVLLEPVR
jgi:2-C-methyl-D-erythritol 2,4-cyclodiphosphate synthase